MVLIKDNEFMNSQCHSHGLAKAEDHDNNEKKFGLLRCLFLEVLGSLIFQSLVHGISALNDLVDFVVEEDQCQKWQKS